MKTAHAARRLVAIDCLSAWIRRYVGFCPALVPARQADPIRLGVVPKRQTRHPPKLGAVSVRQAAVEAVSTLTAMGYPPLACLVIRTALPYLDAETHLRLIEMMRSPPSETPPYDTQTRLPKPHRLRSLTKAAEQLLHPRDARRLRSALEATYFAHGRNV